MQEFGCLLHRSSTGPERRSVTEAAGINVKAGTPAGADVPFHTSSFPQIKSQNDIVSLPQQCKGGRGGTSEGPFSAGGIARPQELGGSISAVF